MSDEKGLISNDRLVRELRIKIRDLSSDFDEKFGKASKSVKDKTVRGTRMSALKDDRDKNRFYHQLEIFDIDKDNNDDLKEMNKNLARLRKALERRLRDLILAREDFEIEDISLEIQKLFQDSPIMKKLLPEDLKQRIENLKYSPEMSKLDYIKLIRAEIKQINFERDSARAVIIANSNPELKKTFDELMKCSEIVNEEATYRNTQREVTSRYNALCHAYKALESIEQELAQPQISEKRRTELIEYRKKVLKDIKEELKDKKYATKEELKELLKSEIEDLAFQKNALNGIVDPFAVKYDKFTVMKLDSFSTLDKIENLTSLEKYKRKNPIVENDPDFSEYAKRIKLKMLMQELALTYQLKAELGKINARLAELNAKKDLTPEEIAERNRLNKQRGEISTKHNMISKRMEEIRKLGNELGIPCVLDGSLDLNSIEQLNSIGVSQVETSIEKQKERMTDKRKKVCEKYDIDASLGDAEVLDAIDKKVKEIELKKRHRIINLDYDQKQDVNAQRSQSIGTNSSVVPLDSEGSVSEKNPNTSIEKGDKEADKDDDFKEKKVIQSMQVYDVQTQLDTNDPRYKQRVEFGRVYRYERGEKDGELNFVEEGLEVYLENPKKKLNEILDGLREKVLAEFPNERELENYCDQIENADFKGLLSKSPLKRAIAKNTLLKKIEAANPNKPAFGYINMAIALNSELLPDAIEETIGRHAQPYNKHESDINKYVKIKGRKTLLGRSEKGEIMQSELNKTNIESIRREEKLTSTIDLETRDDGMVRPFEIGAIEVLTPIKENEQPIQKKTRTRGKKHKSKNKEGEIE